MFCRVSLVRLIFGDVDIFTQPLSILLSVVYFTWARGANARGTTRERGEALPAVAYLPSLLGFPSRALLFLTLSSLAPRFIDAGRSVLTEAAFSGVSGERWERLVKFLRRNTPAGAPRDKGVKG